MPKKELDKLLKESGGNLSYIEKKLSLGDGYLSKSDIKIFHISPNDLNVKIPSGNEGGANSQWLLGGKTANGITEGIADLTKDNLIIREITLGDKQ